MNNIEAADKMLKILHEKTKKKTIHFHLKEEKAGIFGNKIGGMPFVPEGGKYPVSTLDGAKLYLLAQINFETLPHIDNFPEKGILQFYIGASDLYGMGIDDQQKQDTWRVVYHPDISKPMNEEEILRLMPDAPEEEYGLPFVKWDSEFKMDFTEEEMAVTSCDFNFDRLVEKYCGDILGSGLEDFSWFDLPNEFDEKLYGDGTRLSGYPAFTQFDPRESEFENYELLLQIDSEFDDGKEYLMWGGTAA